jgi:hypothetical protein
LKIAVIAGGRAMPIKKKPECEYCGRAVRKPQQWWSYVGTSLGRGRLLLYCTKKCLLDGLPEVHLACRHPDTQSCGSGVPGCTENMKNYGCINF